VWLVFEGEVDAMGKHFVWINLFSLPSFWLLRDEASVVHMQVYEDDEQRAYVFRKTMQGCQVTSLYRDGIFVIGSAFREVPEN